MNGSIVKSVLIDTLGSIDKGKKRIVLRLMTIEDHRYLDIRNFALVNGNWEETYKGVTFTKDSFASFIRLLNERGEEIAEILGPMTPQEFERKINRSLKAIPKKNKDCSQMKFEF